MASCSDWRMDIFWKYLRLKLKIWMDIFWMYFWASGGQQNFRVPKNHQKSTGVLGLQPILHNHLENQPKSELVY